MRLHSEYGGAGQGKIYLVALHAVTVLMLVKYPVGVQEVLSLEFPITTTEDSPLKEYEVFENETGGLIHTTELQVVASLDPKSSSPPVIYSQPLALHPQDYSDKGPSFKNVQEASPKQHEMASSKQALYLNFSLTVGQLPDPNTSIYHTDQHQQNVHTMKGFEITAEGPQHLTLSNNITSTSSETVWTEFSKDRTTQVPQVHTETVFDASVARRHPCDRECVLGASPMRCQYYFVQEWYQTMSKACYGCPLNQSHCDLEHCIAADGVQRTIVVVNRTLPGPHIQVCLGDEIEVVLENAMPEEGAALHWHGLHQRGTPHADGVPFVTQCPVTPGSSFTYVFNASSPGTHFWHSHSGLQRGDGAFGALIVRVPKELDPHEKIYDTDLEEHFMQILDWGHQLGVVTFISHHHGDGDNKPSSILINGKGRYRPFPANMVNTGKPVSPALYPFPVEAGVRNNLRNTTYTPLAVFKVKLGVRHRFRLINAGFLNCPIQLSIDNHTLLVISSDGGDIEPVKVDALVSYAGERFDFILVPELKREAVGRQRKFWARFRGLMDCDDRFSGAHQVAVIEYELDEADGVIIDFNLINEEEPPGEVSYAASERKGLIFNALNVGAATDGFHSVAELNAIGLSEPMPEDPTLKPKADMTFYLGYDFYGKDNPTYHTPNAYGFNQVLDDRQRLQTPQLNHISLRLTPFPLLTQRHLLEVEADHSPFCNESSLAVDGKNCSSLDFCHCTHVLSVPLGAVVELILVDEGVAYDANHPFHLHGHAFRVLGMGRVGKSVSVETIKALDKLGHLHRNTANSKPALKDTVTVPDGGYTVVRFHATNPGYWLFHCHLGFHVELGMALIFKVGEHEDFVPVPNNFPECGSWQSSSNLRVNNPGNTGIRLENIKVMGKESFEENVLYSSCSNQFHSHLSSILLLSVLTYSFQDIILV
uniref:Laccase-like multicopper oxidase 1 n=1 Tax=Nannophya pygmaea TaxID=229391 RepID=A0A2Z5WPZ8_NANPY|nr:laccase-like multicopper oxidase 1 [Nannophya pygmaea]